VVTIGVREYVNQFDFQSVALQFTKLPWTFLFDNLQVTQNGAVVSQIAYNTAVELQWDTSAVDLTEVTFTVSENGGPPQPVTAVGSWTSLPLTTNTNFTLEATVTQPNNQSVSFYLTAAVAVTNPNLSLSSLTVTQASAGDLGGGIATVFLSTDSIGGGPSGSVGLTTQASFIGFPSLSILPPPIGKTSATYKAGTSGFIIVNIVPIVGTPAGWSTIVVTLTPFGGTSGEALTFTVTGINTDATGTGADCTTGNLMLPVEMGATFTFALTSGGATPLTQIYFAPLGVGTATS